MRHTIHGVASAIPQCTWASPWNGNDSDMTMTMMTDAVSDLEYAMMIKAGTDPEYVAFLVFKGLNCQCNWCGGLDMINSSLQSAAVFRKDADPEVEVFRGDDISIGSLLDGKGSMTYRRAHMTSSLICPSSFPQGGHPHSGSSLWPFSTPQKAGRHTLIVSLREGIR